MRARARDTRAAAHVMRQLEFRRAEDRLLLRRWMMLAFARSNYSSVAVSDHKLWYDCLGSK
jgi:hypothetical protein